MHRRSILAGLLLAVLGFAWIPVAAFFVGFPLGFYLEERRQRGRHASAWRSTREALRAIGLSVVIRTVGHGARRRRMAGASPR